MWFIREHLYLGNYWSGERALAGAAMPIDATGRCEPFAAVVSLCPFQWRGEALFGPACLETQWLHLPISDGGRGEEEFACALEICLPFVANRRRVGNVLVHCAAGMSRSVSVIAAVLCSEDPMLDVDEAYRSIARAKAEALGHPPHEARLLVAPAWEFALCLRRRFAESARRANGRP